VVDLMPLVDALPCCPNLKTFKLKMCPIPGGPAWLKLLEHIIEGRLPCIQNPPFDDFHVWLSAAEATASYQAVARAFGAGRFLACESFQLSRCASPMTEDDLSCLATSLPERLGRLRRLYLSTTAASAAIRQLAECLTPDRCPSLAIMVLECEGPTVEGKALVQVLEQAAMLPSLRHLRLFWRHGGEGFPCSDRTLIKPAFRFLEGMPTPRIGRWAESCHLQGLPVL
jgi:hypothetical protein